VRGGRSDRERVERGISDGEGGESDRGGWKGRVIGEGKKGHGKEKEDTYIYHTLTSQ